MKIWGRLSWLLVVTIDWSSTGRTARQPVKPQLLWNDQKTVVVKQWEENMGRKHGDLHALFRCSTKKWKLNHRNRNFDCPNKRFCQEIAMLGNEAGDIPSVEANQQLLVGLWSLPKMGIQNRERNTVIQHRTEPEKWRRLHRAGRLQLFGSSWISNLL